MMIVLKSKYEDLKYEYSNFKSKMLADVLAVNDVRFYYNKQSNQRGAN